MIISIIQTWLHLVENGLTDNLTYKEYYDNMKTITFCKNYLKRFNLRDQFIILNVQYLTTD